MQNNVTHRDVKPDNLLITDEGKLVLSDFGVCAVFDDENHILLFVYSLSNSIP